MSGPLRGRGSRVSRRWWEQDGLDWEGSKNRAAAAAESDIEEAIYKEEGMPLDTTTGQ